MEFLKCQNHEIINHKLLATTITVGKYFNGINYNVSFPSFTAKIYSGSTSSGEVEKYPGDAPDSGYIAIVTIVVATLLVLVLTVVSLFCLESFIKLLALHAQHQLVLDINK